MPRARRLDLAGVAQHVVQRGNDRQPCFFREIDYIRYLQDLREVALRYECKVHAYVLMTNHVHLLVTPERFGNISKMMQAVGRPYVRISTIRLPYWNAMRRPLQVMSCGQRRLCIGVLSLHRAKPCTRSMIAAADQYRWSSHAANAYAQHDPLVSPHTVYAGLSENVAERCLSYRKIVAEGIPADHLEAIRLYVQRQRALGSDRFQIAIERQLGRRAGLGQPGRPRKIPIGT